MSKPSKRRLLILAKKSALRAHQESSDRERQERIARLLRDNDPTVIRMRGAHRQHETTIDEVHAAVKALRCDATYVSAAALDEFRELDPSGYDLVVTVGGDGTLLAASHAIDQTPVLAINSAPDFSVGFFSATRAGRVEETLTKALCDELPISTLTRMSVLKNGHVLTSRVLNEALFCSLVPAETTRYLLEWKNELEEQKSSGIWVGPAAGSTAAQRSAGGDVLPINSTQLQFVVREPYTPPGQTLRFTKGLVPLGELLRVRCKTVDARIYVDGPHECYQATTGDVLAFESNQSPLHLLGALRRE